jgi:hypothetical protein
VGTAGRRRATGVRRDRSGLVRFSDQVGPIGGAATVRGIL